MGTVEVKIADVVIEDKIIDIMGKVREEAFVFIKHYDSEKTAKIINMLRSKEYKINRKLSTVGYFFNGDIDNVSIEPEVIRYLLNSCFSKNVEIGSELGQMGKAIYFDKNYVYHSGKHLSNMVEELYNEHYYGKQK